MTFEERFSQLLEKVDHAYSEIRLICTDKKHINIDAPDIKGCRERFLTAIGKLYGFKDMWHEARKQEPKE